MNLQIALDHREQVEEFRRRHRTGLVTLVFTDLVDSVALRRQLGDQAGTSLLQAHRQLVRQTLARFADAEEIETAGDSFLLLFARPSDAVKFALLVQMQTRALALSGPSSRREEALSNAEFGTRNAEFKQNLTSAATALQARIGIHVGEVVIEEHERGPKPKDVYGTQIDLCARVMGLAEGGQILLTRGVFDSARQALKGEDIEGLNQSQGGSQLQWLNHGPYLLKGIEESVEVCEVGETGIAPLKPPAGSDKAQRQVRADEEQVLGWRPALGQVVPNTQWLLEKKLGEGGFGEVWLGRHQTMKERRVFKFCFRTDRVRSLKREMTLFRLLKERIGDHPNIVRLLEVYFDEPPFYVVMDYVEGSDLKTWSEERGSVASVPLEVRLEIVAQVAEALQAAHDAGVIHRDVKPGNILIAERGVRSADSENPKREGEAPDEPTASAALKSGLARTLALPDVTVKLTDFGIGQVVSQEYLSGITRAGFTQTIVADSSSSQTGSQMYMAPELLAGKPASTCSDIYSLGVVLYQLLVSDLSRPLTTDWADHISDALLRDDLKHCFAGNPQERFAGAGQLATNLRALPERRAVLEQQQAELAARERAAYRRGMMRTAGVAAVIVAMIAGLAVLAFNQSQRAKAAAQAEKQQRERAEKTARRLRLESYAADMRVAFLSLDEQNFGRAVDLLRKHVPKPGDDDLRGFEWRYLWQECRGDELATFQHGGLVNTAVFSADGRLIATASFSGTVKIWDVATRTLLKTFDGFPQDNVRNYVAISPEGRRFAACRGQDVVVWDTSTWNPITTLSGDAAPLMFSPDGSVLAGWGRAGLRLWNAQRWEPEAIPTGVPYYTFLNAMAFAPDSRIFAIASASSTNVEVWSVHTPTNVATFTFPSASGFRSDGITSLAISKNGILAAGRYPGEGAVKLWNLSTRLEIMVTNLHPRTVSGLAFSPDGKVLASASYDQTVKLWNVQTLSLVSTLQGHQNEVWTVAFAPDGRSLLSGSKDGTAKLWSASPKPQPELIPAGTNWAGFSSDGKFLIVTASTRTNVSLEYWDISTARLAKTRDLSSEPAFAAIKDRLAMAPVVAPGGQTLALAMQDGSVHVLDLATMALTPTTLSPQLDLKDISVRLFFSRDGRVLCLRNENRTNLWVPSLQGEIPIPRDCLVQNRFGETVALSLDGKMLAGPSRDYVVKLWDAATGRELRALKGHAWILTTPLFSPNGQLLATMSWENAPRLWNVADGTEAVPPLKGHKEGGFRAAFSPDSRTFATSNAKGTKLWNVNTGQEIVSFDSDVEPLFSPDGNTLALRVPGGNVRLVHVLSLAEIDATEKASPDRK